MACSQVAKVKVYTLGLSIWVYVFVKEGFGQKETGWSKYVSETCRWKLGKKKPKNPFT
jgi:hypothetical protein